MSKAIGTAIAALMLVASGSALAEPGPKERECMVGEQRIDGECQPLTRGPNNRGDQGSTGDRGDSSKRQGR